jgi:hypothetical protein
VTSPPVRIDVVCPGCALEYEAWYRPSINLTLGEEWTDTELHAATTAACPGCGVEVALESLVISDTGLGPATANG